MGNLFWRRYSRLVELNAGLEGIDWVHNSTRDGGGDISYEKIVQKLHLWSYSLGHQRVRIGFDLFVTRDRGSQFNDHCWLLKILSFTYPEHSAHATFIWTLQKNHRVVDTRCINT